MPDTEQRPNDALGDDEVVIRRVPDIQLHRRPDGKREVGKGSFSASSKLVDPEQGMSVDLLSLLAATGVDPTAKDHYATDFDVLMILKVRDLHSQGFWVVPRPIEGNPAHCNVLSLTSNRRKAVFRMAEFLRRPNDVIKAGD